MREFWEKVFMAAFQVRCQSAPLDDAVNLAAMAANRAICSAMAANRAVKECPKEEPPEPPEEGGWISVKDRLPGIDAHVLTYCSEPGVNPFAVLYYLDAVKSFTSGYSITHWRWLPEPPEETP